MENRQALRRAPAVSLVLLAEREEGGGPCCAGGRWSEGSPPPPGSDRRGGAGAGPHDAHRLAGGGGALSGGNYTLHSNIGQPAVGGVGNSPYDLQSGFQRCAVAHDVSDNGLVDATDVQSTAGRWRSTSPGLVDRDGDGQVTVRDAMLVAAQWGDGC